MSKVLNINLKGFIIAFLIIIGILLRFLVKEQGYNYDFVSYCIVGKIASNLQNVYAHTERYNYAPFFMIFQGLFYKFAHIWESHFYTFYRILIVSLLTLTDLGITLFIAKKYSVKASMLFFLNPVSIIITGFHNQFDNIAVLFALLSTLFFNNEEKFGKKDFCFVLFVSLSLLAKHILFMFPLFILLMKDLPIKKKLVYSFVPPLIFLISFVPFALTSDSAFQGILNNVFLYRSKNNSPLLGLLYCIINFPDAYKFIVYIIFMAITAYIIRNYKYEKILLLYLIAMVAFASSIVNQYLVIPMAALCILEVGWWKYLYTIYAAILLWLHPDGLAYIIRYTFPNIVKVFHLGLGYPICALLLFIILVTYIRKTNKSEVYNN